MFNHNPMDIMGIRHKSHKNYVRYIPRFLIEYTKWDCRDKYIRFYQVKCKNIYVYGAQNEVYIVG